MDVLVTTSDKLRKMLAHGSPWLRERSLSVLAMDEVENEEYVEVVAAAIHFDLVLLAGDRSQGLCAHRGPVPVLHDSS